MLALAGCATAPTEYHEPPPLAAAARSAHNLAVFDRAWTLVNGKYFDPHFHGVNWAAERDRFRPAAAAAPDEGALYRVLHDLNATLKESHLAAISPRRAHDRQDEHQAAVGIRMLPLDGRRVVTEVLPDSPAAAAGVRPGWIVVSRNGAPIREGDPFVARLGQPVTFAFLDAQDRPRTLTFAPRLLDFTRREALSLPGGIRLLRFDEFGRAAVHWLSAQLKAQPRPAGVVIDLRQNPGGNALALSVAIAEFFPGPVAEGRVVKRNGSAREEHSLPWLSAHYAGPVVILTGPGTASAAEIFSHVLQFHRRARLVGQKTAGAVIYSRLYPLPGGGRLQVPVTDYVGLDGRRLEGRGVTPDVVTPPATLADLRAGRDPDLAAALNLLHQAASGPTP